MKILVTGAKGQVGSALCRLGIKGDFAITGMDSKQLNICDQEAVASALTSIKPTILINCAAYTAVDKAETEPAKADLINGLAPGYLAMESAARNIPLIQLSTDYVFDGSKIGSYVESDPVAPLGVYGRSKLKGEQLVREYQSQHIIMRTSWVFGLEGNNFPKTMIRLARERPEIGVVADQRGCPTFADDIARALLAMASQCATEGNLPWGVYHYAGAEPTNWYDFASFLLDYAVRNKVVPNMPKLRALTTSEYPTAAVRPPNSVLGCEKFTAAFADVALSDWKAGVGELLGAIQAGG